MISIIRPSTLTEGVLISGMSFCSGWNEVCVYHQGYAGTWWRATAIAGWCVASSCLCFHLKWKWRITGGWLSCLTSADERHFDRDLCGFRDSSVIEMCVFFFSSRYWICRFIFYTRATLAGSYINDIYFEGNYCISILPFVSNILLTFMKRINPHKIQFSFFFFWHLLRCHVIPAHSIVTQLILLCTC